MGGHEGAYAWWETVEGPSLYEGDLFIGIELYIPRTPSSAPPTAIPLDARLFNLIVMTQSCDIENSKVSNLLLCPWWDLWSWVDAGAASGVNTGSKIRDELRKGNVPGYHLLNEASQEGMSIGMGVVDFHEVHTATVAHVREFATGCGQRLRLKPPYREHLSQAFARFFMRVGLPVDIPKEKVTNRPSHTPFA